MKKKNATKRYDDPGKLEIINILDTEIKVLKLAEGRLENGTEIMLCRKAPE